MNCTPFFTGMAMGMGAGVAVGMKLTSRQRQIRRVIRTAARDMEDAFDRMAK